MAAIETPVIKPIIEQHAEEAAFLWLLRDAAVHEPHYSLKALAHLDERVEAHIDGLRIAGVDGWQICAAALALEEPGELFVAAVLAFESDDGARIEEVIHAGMSSKKRWRALVSATGWLSENDYRRWTTALLSANSIEYRRLAVAASVVRRHDPGQALNDAIEDANSFHQASALRAVGELKRYDLLPQLRQRFSAEDGTCRFWAAWSALLLGDHSALKVIKQFVNADSAYREQALQIALRVMDSTRSQSWLKDLATQPELLRHVLIATGVVGDPLYIPTLIKQMSKPEVARVAGAAFATITGVDLAYDELESEWPEGFEAGPTEDVSDENVDMDADEDLPWPAQGLLQTWWDKNRHRFQPGERYLVGEPISQSHCNYLLKNGLQRQRYAAALELALTQPETPLFETSARAAFQNSRLQWHTHLAQEENSARFTPR